jgi:hypothetical protein
MPKYSVDESRFAVDSLDNEIIIMDLLEGKLYLFEEGAATILSHLLRGCESQNIEVTVKEKYGQEALTSAQSLIVELVEKEILSEVESNQDADAVNASNDWPESLGNFVTSEYDDMTSIITMDPIHDVDYSKGWPFTGTA